MYSLFSFRYAPVPPASSRQPSGRQDAGGTSTDALNLRLVEAINADGRIYLTQTRVDGAVAIRFQVGQFECTEADVMSAYEVITQLARGLATLPGVRDVRGRGLLLAAVLDRDAGEVVDSCRERGLLVLTAGPDVLRLLPPLTVAETEVDQALRLLADVLG